MHDRADGAEPASPGDEAMTGDATSPGVSGVADPGANAGAVSGAVPVADGDADAAGGIDELLRAYLAGRDAWCPGCAYNLRGLATDRCPECGLRVEVGLRGVMPGLKPWIASVIMTCTSLGLALMMLITGTIFFLRVGLSGFRNEMELLAFVAYGVFLAGSVIHLVLLVRRRTTLWQRPKRGLMGTCFVSAGMLSLPLLLIVVQMVYI